MKHKSVYYKLYAVNYYLEKPSIAELADIENIKFSI